MNYPVSKLPLNVTSEKKMPYRLRQWLGYKSPLEKILMVLLGIALIVIIVLASVMKHNIPRKSGVTPENCATIPCLTESVNVMRHTDPTINPCDDFFEFACGGFRENANENEKMPYLRLQTEQFIEVCDDIIRPNEHAIVKLAKKIYGTCISDDGLTTNSKKTLLNAINAAGGWPVLQGQHWDEKNFDWKNASYIFRELGYYDELFVDINVDYDVDNKTNFILEVLLADAYDYKYGILGADKPQIMIEVAALFVEEETPEMLSELTEAHMLQQSLQELVYYKQHSDHPHKKYSIAEYQKLCDSINWLELINKILGPKVQVTSDQIALFPPPEVFKKWLDTIHKASKRIQANYMMWKTIERLLPFLSKELQYYNIGLTKRQKREDACLDLIGEMGLLHPIQIVLHRKYVSTNRKKAVEDLVANMKNEFINSLNRSELFKSDHLLKQQALNKFKALKIVASPNENYQNDDIFNDLAIEPINPDQGTYLEFLCQATKNKRTLRFLLLKQINNAFITFIRIVPTYYIEEDNTIYALGLATHNTYINENRPNYVNYGIIGSMLQHTFNQVLEKNINNNSTTININTCISNGNFTDAEFLAYLALGQQVSYASYQNWVRKNGKEPSLAQLNYTPNQLYWISSASTFCEPNNFHRFYSNKLKKPKTYVNKAIGSTQRFARDFNCPEGSKMYPRSKCGIA